MNDLRAVLHELGFPFVPNEKMPIVPQVTLTPSEVERIGEALAVADQAAETSLLNKLRRKNEELSEALRSASVEEDRARAHTADLAEALAALHLENDEALNRIKVETALHTCLAFQEFVEGFAGRLRAVMQNLKPKDEAPPA